jgi:hypothetical protein
MRRRFETPAIQASFLRDRIARGAQTAHAKSFFQNR